MKFWYLKSSILSSQLYIAYVYSEIYNFTFKKTKKVSIIIIISSSSGSGSGSGSSSTSSSSTRSSTSSSTSSSSTSSIITSIIILAGWISSGYHKTIHVHWNSFGVEFGEEVQPGDEEKI